MCILKFLRGEVCCDLTANSLSQWNIGYVVDRKVSMEKWLVKLSFNFYDAVYM